MKKPYSLFLFLIITLFPIYSNAAVNNNFLVISDIHLDNTTLHAMEISPTGNNRENDLDQTTFEKLITELNSNIKNGTLNQPKFILVLGDIVGHHRSSSDNLLASESIVFSQLKKTFPTTPIFYTYGNNDSLAINYGPFNDASRTDQYKSPYAIAKLKSGWLDGYLSTGKMCRNYLYNFPCIITEDTNNGYYSAYLDHQLRLISLNSVLFSPNRAQVTEQDAINQLQWLEAQLKIAKANKESVLLAMHVSPGNNIYDHSTFWLPKEQAAFLKIINTYQETIIGLLASHTHEEELKIIKNSAKNNISGIYFTAALSTAHGNEPSVKLFTLAKNKNQWLLSNYTTYHFSLENSHLIFNKLYDFKTYYCAPGDKDELFQCLNNVTLDKMKIYFSAGNKNYSGIISSPDDINLIDYDS